MTDRFRENEDNWKEYSLVEHLKNVCSNNEKYKNLYAVWTLDQETHSRALSAIYYNFPHYSMHDESHSLSIINKIEMLLGEDRIRSLSPTDTFLILESAYLHDIGMIVAQQELIEEWKKPTFEHFLKDLKENSYDKDTVEAATYLLQMQKAKNPFQESDWPVKVRHYVTIITSEYYRGKHSIRSANFIKEGTNIGLNSNYNKLIPNRLIVLLQKIAIFHGTSFEDSFNKLEQFDNGIGTDTIHPRFIASLLRLGDLLDLDDGRFNEVFENVGYFPETSKIHKEKHKSITLFLVSPEKIQVSAVCKDPDSYRETRAWFDWLKEEVKNLSSRWADIVPKGFKGGPPSLGNIKLSIEGSENITEQLDLQFNIDQKRAFELIEGQGIYSDKLIFIRELMQNSMDATKIQMWKDIKSGKYDGVSEDLLGKDIDEYRLEDIKDNKNLEFPRDFPEKIKKYYPINISLDYDEDKEKLIFSIEDRGCGISINDLKRMEKVGGSWNQDRESMNFIDKMPEFLQPTGNFGIGLHSVFLATDELKIQTKSEDDIGYDLTFVSRRKNGYITVKEDMNKKVVGTKMTLNIYGKDKINKCINSISHESQRKINKIIEKFDIFECELDKKLLVNKIICYIEGVLGNTQFYDIYINKNKYSEYEESLSETTNNVYSECKLDEYATFRRRSEKVIDIEINDKKEGMTVIVQDSNKDSLFRRNIIYKFKDITCQGPVNFGLDFFNYNINIYKGKTKHILGVSRDFINYNKLISIQNRIETELMPKIMKKLGENLLSLKTLNEIEKLEENENLSHFLFAYKKYTGDYLKLSNNNLAKNIIMGNLHKIEANNKILYKKICYNELININSIICIENPYGIDTYNDNKLDRASRLNNKGTNYICSWRDFESNTKMISHITDNFKINTIEMFDKYEAITVRSRNNNTIEFSDNEYRYKYIKSLIKLKSRHIIPPIKSIKSDVYKILYVNPWKYNLPLKDIRNVDGTYDKFIILPFYDIPKGYFLEKDTEYILEFLKRERYFNKLIDCVAEHSLEKENYKGEDIKACIENAYREFIQECIDVEKKEKEILDKEKTQSEPTKYNDGEEESTLEEIEEVAVDLELEGAK